MGELLAEKARVAEEEAALLGKKASDAEEEIKRLRMNVSKVCMYILYLIFFSQLMFVFPLFLGMVMYANEFETKGKKTTTDTSIFHRGECRIHRDHHPCMNILDKKQAPQTCRTLGEAELIILNDYSLTNTVFVYSLFFLQSGDERVAMERRAREAAEERLRRVMQEAEAR